MDFMTLSWIPGDWESFHVVIAREDEEIYAV